MLRTVSTTALFSVFAMFATCSEQKTILCPPMKEYSQSTQKAAAEEYAQVATQFPTITQYIADYKQLRDGVRICRNRS